MLTPDELLASVERYLTEHGVAPSRFGKEVLGDPSFVFELRKGREPRSKIVKKVLEVIEKHDAERAAA